MSGAAVSSEVLDSRLPQRVLITGAAGFIGSSLAIHLLKRGIVVIGIDSFASNYDEKYKRKNLEDARAHDGFVFFEADIRESAVLRGLLADWRPTCIVHLAALGNVRRSVDAAEDYVSVNVSGTTSVLQAAIDERVEQVFLASTSSVYGQVTRQVMSETDPTDRPLAPYPASKKACEVIAYSFHSAHGINVAIGRFFNAYGPRGRPDMMPWRVLESLVEGRRIPVFGDGSIARDWTYIDDVIDGIVGALAWNPHYEIVNLGRGEPVTLNAFIEHLSELTGCRPLVENVRMPPTEPLRTCADVTKAARMFGYRPTVHLREGLARFREWWEKEATP